MPVDLNDVSVYHTARAPELVAAYESDLALLLSSAPEHVATRHNVETISYGESDDGYRPGGTESITVAYRELSVRVRGDVVIRRGCDRDVVTCAVADGLVYHLRPGRDPAIQWDSPEYARAEEAHTVAHWAAVVASRARVEGLVARLNAALEADAETALTATREAEAHRVAERARAAAEVAGRAARAAASIMIEIPSRGGKRHRIADVRLVGLEHDEERSGTSSGRGLTIVAVPSSPDWSVTWTATLDGQPVVIGTMTPAGLTWSPLAAEAETHPPSAPAPNLSHSPFAALAGLR